MSDIHRRILLCLAVGLALSAACTAKATPTQETIDELMAIVAVSDPRSPQHDIDAAAFAAFAEATDKLRALGNEAAPAAPLLAEALAYPRRDSYVAARSLVALGPQAANALPILIDNLTSDRPDVRALSAYVLGTIGPPASCAVPQLAPLLWDSDPFARTSAAAALDAITGHDLVEPTVQLSPDPALAGSVFADDPAGSISATARDWWLQGGSTIEWRPTYTACDP